MEHKHYYDDVAYRSLGASIIRDVDEKKPLWPYFENLRAALRDDTVTNIAVFGKFGAGKTTVIKSFLNEEKHNSEIRPLFLSLATFTRDVEQGVPANKSEEGEWVAIEHNLVQQMLYGPSNKDLPDSKYRKIESKTSNNNNRLVTLLECFLLCTFLLIDPWHIMSIIPNPNVLNGIKIILTVIFIILSWRGLKLVFMHYPRWFSSATLGWGKSELSIKDGQSAFNEYLDEIIYFFSEKKYNLVVLEDIDRSKNLDLFEHLRELNQILNKNEALREAFGLEEGVPAIKFLYAVKEDLFDNMKLNNPTKEDTDGRQGASEKVIAEATTKFFDWTMTVLPKVSSMNSADFLMEMFVNPTTEFRNFLRSVSIYFDDVRVLENSINDFKLHSEMQSQADLDAIKMLTVLLFKNGFPREYQRFIRQESSLHKIIRTRWLATQTINKLKEELSDLEARRHSVVSLTQNQVLGRYKALFFDLGADRTTSIESSHKEVKIDAIGNMTIQELASLYQYVKNQGSIQSYFRHSQSGGWTRISYDKLLLQQDDFDSDLYFSDDVENSDIIYIDNQIQEKKRRLFKISQSTLLDFVTENEVNVSEYLTDADEAQDFLSFSIVNGYLDETVDDYLSRFTGTRISLNDRQIVRRLRSGDKLSFNESIDSVINFVGDLVPSDLDKSSIQLGEIILYVVPQKSMVSEDILVVYNVVLQGLANENSESFSSRFEWLLDHIDRAYYVTLVADMTDALKNNWSKYSGDQTALFADELIKGLQLTLLTNCIATMPGLDSYINENNWPLTWAYISECEDRTDAIFKAENIMLNRLDSSKQTDLKLVDYLIGLNALSCNEMTVPTVLLALANGEQDALSYQLIMRCDDSIVGSWVTQWFSPFMNAELALGYIEHESSESLGLMLTHAGMTRGMVTRILAQYPRADLQLSDIHLSDEPTEFEMSVVMEVIESGHIAMSWRNLRWLVDVKSIEWRQKFLNQFVVVSANLEAMIHSADSVDREALRQLVNSVQIQLTDLNMEILSKSDQYLGVNQNSKMLSFLISAKVVEISEELIERVTEQSEIQTLVISFVDTNVSEWDEMQRKLFERLNATSLLKIATGKVIEMLSYQHIANHTLIQNYIGQPSFTDDSRGELLESMLRIDEIEASEREPRLLEILNSYLSENRKIEKLTSLINDGLLGNNDIRASLTSIKDPELTRITTAYKGATLHLENSNRRWRFVNALLQVDFIQKAIVLKTQNISVRI